MKRALLIAVLLLAAPLLVAQTGYFPGQTVASLTNKTSAGAGTAYALPLNPSGAFYHRYTWTVTFKTAAPAAQTTNLEGSIDNTNWYTRDTSTNISYTSDTVSGEM